MKIKKQIDFLFFDHFLRLAKYEINSKRIANFERTTDGWTSSTLPPHSLFLSHSLIPRSIPLSLTIQQLVNRDKKWEESRKWLP